MATELEAVRAARDAALATIAAHAEAPQVRIGDTDTSGPPHRETPQTPVLSSLKRKRSDESDENEDEDGLKRSVDIGVGVGDAADVTMADAADPTTFTTTNTTTNTSGIDVPSPKRARRIATAVLHTATAVTVGAVAAWSALAFS